MRLRKNAVHGEIDVYSEMEYIAFDASEIKYNGIE